MPLSQRDQYSDKKGMGLVRLGGVVCLAAFVFGSVCFTIVATFADGENPPKIFEQMGGASCAIFTFGLILGLVGWLISLNQPEEPKPTLKDLRPDLELNDEPSEENIDSAEAKKPSPYASDHRRR
eukprot:g14459.t1